MDYNLIDVLLVEDNVDDAELAMRELKKSQVRNNLLHVKDGERRSILFLPQENLPGCGKFKMYQN